jgi:phosphopantothenoylcysteine decarboxylase/phosphopantothenate--cysteine ligase
MLKGKKIVLGVTGGIAAYKAAQLSRMFIHAGADVHVVMTENATKFITPLTFRSLTGNPVTVDMFEPVTNWQIEHIELATMADIVVIAPATANVIGKIASGMADDMLTTTVMATKAPVIIAPAMNSNMYNNPIVQGNVEKLKGLGYEFVEPEEGRLATGTEGAGKGRLADLEKIVQKVSEVLERRG